MPGLTLDWDGVAYWRDFNARLARGEIAPAPDPAHDPARDALLLDTILPDGLPRFDTVPTRGDRAQWARAATAAAPLLDRIDRRLEEDV